VPWYRIFYAGWVTTDGEHPNERYKHSELHDNIDHLYNNITPTPPIISTTILPLHLLFFLLFYFSPISYGTCRGNVIVAREVSKLLLEWFQNFNNSMISEPDHLPSNEFMDDQVTD